MNTYHAIILGIVEGVTEFLPISSTGHLMLLSQFLGLRADNFLKSFEISIQLGAIMAVALLYGKDFLTKLDIVKKVLVAFIPTGILGFVLYKVVREFFLESTNVVLWSLFLGGVVLIIFEWRYKEEEHSTKELDSVSYRQSLFIGMAQGVSIVPGVSRAGATILGGLLVGLQRKTIVEFSFLLALPTMLTATSFDLWKNANYLSLENFGLLAVGFATSFIVAVFSVKFLLWYVQSHSFIAFGAYRIILAIIFWYAV